MTAEKTVNIDDLERIANERGVRVGQTLSPPALALRDEALPSIAVVNDPRSTAPNKLAFALSWKRRGSELRIFDGSGMTTTTVAERRRALYLHEMEVDRKLVSDFLSASDLGESLVTALVEAGLPRAEAKAEYAAARRRVEDIVDLEAALEEALEAPPAEGAKAIRTWRTCVTRESCVRRRFMTATEQTSRVRARGVLMLVFPRRGP